MKKKSVIKKLFAKKEGMKVEDNSSDFSELPLNSDLASMFDGGFGSSISNGQDSRTFRVFVATWNVGGIPPNNDLNLDDFLQVREESDIYVLGFQEIVPLNAGNVLVLEDNEPAAKWLVLINRALNRYPDDSAVNNGSDPKSTSARGFKLATQTSTSLFFPKPSLKTISKVFRTESRRRLKTCNCTSEMERKCYKDACFRFQKPYPGEVELSSDEDENPSEFELPEFSSTSNTSHMKYGLVASRQMVGIFVTIWARKELVHHVAHLRVCSVSRGIMGCLGNKGCISVSFSFYQTNFCFVCSHLASGEKEGDELRRNLDVIEILKNTQFSKTRRIQCSRVPEKIINHERVIWLGDLNYRIALSYSEARKLLEENQWDALLACDQLKIEREAGRVFQGWNEGKIFFAPTYKYSYNSDTYAGENITSKNKRRTPAWCDRILWHGDGIRLLSYLRKESRFSDHRPVCATFLVNVNVNNDSRKGNSCSSVEVEIEGP